MLTSISASLPNSGNNLGLFTGPCFRTVLLPTSFTTTLSENSMNKRCGTKTSWDFSPTESRFSAVKQRPHGALCRQRQDCRHLEAQKRPPSFKGCGRSLSFTSTVTQRSGPSSDTKGRPMIKRGYLHRGFNDIDWIKKEV